MSKKHEQRTRAEILAKRKNLTLNVEFRRIRVQPVESRSKYMPHIGAKEQARAERCYMSPTFNCSGNLRAAPVMHQIAKASREEILWQQEYDSAF